MNQISAGMARSPLVACMALALSLITPLPAQNRVGSWQIYTSILDVRSVVYSHGELLAATGGGVIRYDPGSGELTTLDPNSGLAVSDIISVARAGDWIWMGSAAPEGVIQLYNVVDGAYRTIDLGLGKITHIIADTTRAFVAFAQGFEIGLVELRLAGGRFEYFDIYPNLPGSPSVIMDLDLYGDSIFVTTNLGVLGNDINGANLKDPGTWHENVGPGGVSVIQYHVDSDGHAALEMGAFHLRDSTGWIKIRDLFVTTYRNMTRINEGPYAGHYALSISNKVWFIDRSGSVLETPRLGGQVTDFTDAPEFGGGFAAMRQHGFAFYDYSTRKWSAITPNTLAGQAYTAITKRSNGDIVALGRWGLTRFDGVSWYNILPGLSILPNALEDRVHAGSQQSSDSFQADTLVFRGKQSWTILEMPDGDLLFGFRGNPSRGVGVMRLNLDDVSHIDFDTTGGILDGLHDGFITIRHMLADSAGNIWIATPFGQIYRNALSIYRADGEWSHFPIGAGGHLQGGPTELAFDSQGRLWIGNDVNSVSGSTGGLTVLDYNGTLDDPSDDTWTSFNTRLKTSGSNIVWSIAFDHSGVLWVITPNGIMGYNVLPGPILQQALGFGPLLPDVPFDEGAKIRVDAENNKWITTPSDGLWVVLENGTFWPSVEGLSTENSDLPSNEILDIFLDDDEGIAYLATSKGIAALKMPFKSPVPSYQDMVLFPSPFRIPSAQPLVVGGLRQGSSVKIFTVNGNLVRELSALSADVQGYQAMWDGRNESGKLVGSGVYLVSAYLQSGSSGVRKVAVIRR
ncbi:MAG: hypothetical protein IIA59_06530 [Candidatus Marinimicrobia bacterium]|nr:hypothetical protein [Candidatus Neomarinimicrobiota bacterium]